MRAVTMQDYVVDLEDAALACDLNWRVFIK